MSVVKYSETDNIGVITFDNPKNLNSLDFEVLKKLGEIINKIEYEKKIRCLILTGAGQKAFIAGGDIALQNTFDVIDAHDWAEIGHNTLRRIEKLKMPVIGAINGYALGGGTEVALVCDILIASEKAIFAQPEVSLGIIPGFGGTQRLARKIGINLAKELIFTGRWMKAEEAMKAGLVNKVVPHAQLMGVAMNMAKDIVKNSSHAVKYAKISIDEGIQVDIDRGLAIEKSLFSICFSTDEQKKAMTNFISKNNRRNN